MVIVKLSTAILQLLAVRNSVTLPFAVSNALGTYVALSAVLDGVKIPVPLLLHVPVVAPPATTPLSVTAALFPHTVTSLPAEAVPAGRIEMVMVSLTALHEPLPVEVSVMITLPAVESAALHWYVALSVVLFGTNVPDPDVVQMPVFVGPETLPLRETLRLVTHTV